MILGNNEIHFYLFCRKTLTNQLLLDNKVENISILILSSIHKMSESETPVKKSSKTLRRQNYKSNEEIREYYTKHKCMLMTTRFNNETWSENVSYRNKNTKYGCIYPTPEQTNASIETNTVLFIIEMNNDSNLIMGIGMVKNTVLIKKHRVYSNENYNRYAYIGKHRIDRETMKEDELKYIQDLETMCFKGARHLKRLQGIKAFPMDRLYDYKCEKQSDMIECIIQMFKNRM